MGGGTPPLRQSWEIIFVLRQSWEMLFVLRQIWESEVEELGGGAGIPTRQSNQDDVRWPTRRVRTRGGTMVSVFFQPLPGDPRETGNKPSGGKGLGTFAFPLQPRVFPGIFTKT